MASQKDYHTRHRSERTIAMIAMKWREAAGIDTEHTFNIVAFVECVLAKKYSKNGSRLTIEFYDKEFPEDDPAFVTYEPLTLNVDRKIWSDAKEGDPYARYVIAHEIGHIVLHDKSELAFSKEGDRQLKFDDPEHSAEWQANTFAAYFLVSDKSARRAHDPQVLAIVCNVDPRLAYSRFVNLRKRGPVQIDSYDGDACPECANFTLVRNGTCLKCDTCGSTTGCS